MQKTKFPQATHKAQSKSLSQCKKNCLAPFSLHLQTLSISLLPPKDRNKQSFKVNYESFEKIRTKKHAILHAFSFYSLSSLSFCFFASFFASFSAFSCSSFCFFSSSSLAFSSASFASSSSVLKTV